MQDSWLYATSLFGLGFVAVAFLVSLATYRSVVLRFLRQAGALFLLPFLGFLAMASGVNLSDAVTLFLLAEFLYLIALFVGYVRGLLNLRSTTAVAAAGTIGFFAPWEPYLNAVLMIGSVYLAFTVAGTFLQGMLSSRKGSGVVLASFFVLGASVVAQVFYEFQGSIGFLRAGLLLFLASAVLFELPLVLSVPWGKPLPESTRSNPR